MAAEAATTNTLRKAIHCWGFLFCILLHGSRPENGALAWKAEHNFAANGAGGCYSRSSSERMILSQRVLLGMRGGEIVHLRTIEETEALVAEHSEHDDQLVVISFSSTNCAPCKKVAPLFEELSEEFPNIVFCKVNVDENPATATKYGVIGWPAFLFLKKGEKVMEIVGGKLAEATLYDWVKLFSPKDKAEEKQQQQDQDDS